jgi:hypothetical protein
VDPRENRLTESFAAVLERVDGLAHYLVADWCRVAVPSEEAWIRTQRVTVGGNLVDLEIGFGSDAAPGLRVWVEVKHGADLHELQLDNYRRDMTVEIHGEAQLVVLAPRGAVDGSEADVSVAWQDVAPSVKSFADEHEIGPVDRWLIDEFLDYLKEEALSDEEALTPAHAFALAARPASDRLLERLLELTQAIVTSQLEPPKDFLKRSGSKNPAFGIGWYALYPIADDEAVAERWGGAWIEWTCRADDFRSEPHDAIGFFVGAGFQKMKGSALSRPENAAWIAALETEGFERVQAWYWRLWRARYPEELMAEATLAGQAQRLADWVIDGIRAIRSSPPPA